MATDPVSATLPSPKFLSEPEFERVIRATPLVSIDVIIRDRDGRILVALRNDEPAKGSLFVPGGCIVKCEPMEAAFERILAREIGCRVPYASACFRGIYQHFYRTTRFGPEETGTHYVVLAHDLALPSDVVIALDRSHATYHWLSEADLLASPDVHEYVKDYFRPARRTHHAAM